MAKKKETEPVESSQVPSVVNGFYYVLKTETGITVTHWRNGGTVTVATGATEAEIKNIINKHEQKL